MSTMPTRTWFQIHLSTAIVMMLVAGGFLGMNLYRRESKEGLELSAKRRQSEFFVVRSEFFGSGTVLAEYGFPLTIATERWWIETDDWSWRFVFANVGIGMLFIVVTGFTSEYLTRRREPHS